MDHIKKIITWVGANKQKSMAIVIAVVVVIALIK